MTTNRKSSSFDFSPTSCIILSLDSLLSAKNFRPLFSLFASALTERFKSSGLFFGSFQRRAIHVVICSKIRHDLDPSLPRRNAGLGLVNALCNKLFSFDSTQKRAPQFATDTSTLSSFALNASSSLWFFTTMCTIAYATPINRAPTSASGLVSFARFYFICLPYRFFWEERPKSKRGIKFTIYQIFSNCKSPRNAGYLSAVGSDGVHRGGGIHSVAYRRRRPPHSRQEDQAHSALVRRLFDHNVSSRLHTKNPQKSPSYR